MGCGASASKYENPHQLQRSASGKIGALKTGYFLNEHGAEVDIRSFYDIDWTPRYTGRCSFIVATHKQTKQAHAITRWNHDKRSKKQIETEIALMKRLDHPNIMSLCEVFEQQSSHFLVMKLCDGGLLLDAIRREKSFSEKNAAAAMYQVLRGVQFMHKQRVAHRALCPDVLRLQETVTNWSQCSVCIADFSNAHKFERGVPMKEKIQGLGDFAAPELLKGKYTEACDNWSCGAILCEIVCGKPPKCNEDHTVSQLPKNRADGCKLKGPVQDLMQRLLESQENKRHSATEAIYHVWTQKGVERLQQPITVRQVEQMKTFCHANKLKKVALHVIARSLTGTEVADLKRRFEAMDPNNKGYIVYQDLKKAIEVFLKNGASWRETAAVPEDVHDLLSSLDVNGDREISYSEFVAATMNQRFYTTPNTCWSAFSVFDADGNGSISREEIQMILQTDTLMGPEDIGDRDIIQEADQNGDGEIDFQEFVNMMCAEQKIVCRPRPSETLKCANDHWAFRAPCKTSASLDS
eukprot:TRINITY_DN20046_c0_g1_i1.p1 TRINITY_DN20046_c0_g1~~TRINITY_DN20046_c0_g1_i1.p1  ORF type:complete len:523 (-),score=91.98 TRINITY_DN20046_c0_g1_i1:910-2478(-)